MKKVLFLAIACTICLSACKKEEITPGKTEPTGITTLFANHEQPRTKISISINHEESGVDKLFWKTGDKLAVFEMAVAVGSAANNHTIALDETGAPIAHTEFILKSGAGTASAEFYLNGEHGLDPTKKYVAFNTMKKMSATGTAADVFVRRTFDANRENVRIGGTNEGTSSTNGDLLCESNMVLYAPIVFEEGNLMPLSFKPIMYTIMEFDLMLDPSLSGDITLTSIQLNSLAPGTTTGASAFPSAIMTAYDENLQLKVLKFINATSSYKFTSGGKLALKQDAYTKFRFPIFCSAKGTKDIKVTITLSVDGASKTYIETFTMPADADKHTFEANITHWKPITIVL